MKIIFMGTDEFGIPALMTLVHAGGHEILTVVTQPDRPKKRNPHPTAPPMKEAAIKLGIPVFQPEKIRSQESIEYIKSLSPDLIITASYGQILPKPILESARIAAINIHASLLPKYRGAAPIHRAIMNGENKTGITLMHMDVGLDTGDIIDMVDIDILDSDTTGNLYEKLSRLGAEVLMSNVEKLRMGLAKRIPQNHEQCSYASMLTKEEERVDWNVSNKCIVNQIRAFNPSPGMFTQFKGQNLKIWKATTLKSECEGTIPGCILSASKKGLEVATKEGSILIKELQIAGKKRVDSTSFINGYKNLVGTILGE